MNLKKILALIAIGVAGVWTSVVAAAFVQRNRDVKAVAVPVVSTTTVLAARGVQLDDKPRHGPAVTCSTAMKEYRVENTRNLVFVRARAYIYSRDNQDSYMWMVRIVSAGEDHKEVYRKVYDDQIFRLPAEGEMEPTFEDFLEVPLPNGKYIVETSVFHIKPEVGLAGLDNPDLLLRLQTPRECRPIQIND